MARVGGVGLVYDERMCAHQNVDDPFHPEQPARITSIFKALESAGIVDRCERVEARDATPAELASVHTQEHVANMCTVSNKKLGKSKRAELARRHSIYFNEGSSSAALLAAGSVVEVGLRVARGDLRAGAAVVRPPGHHAEADAAMGFCLFNNVAVAAHVLVHGNPHLGVQKVLIVDWDVHHGNGTQHMFWKDPQVLYFSVHRYDFGDFYPGGDGGNYDKIGEGSGAGFNINVPWPQGGFGDLDYLAVFDHVLMPVAQEFMPDLVFVSGGFDSARGDPLGGCEVTPAGYSQMTRKVPPLPLSRNPGYLLSYLSGLISSAETDELSTYQLSDASVGKINQHSALMGLANGRVVLALEGGYNLESISESYLACMKVLLGDLPEKIRSSSPDSYLTSMKVLLGDKHSPAMSAKEGLLYTFLLVNQVRCKLQQYWPVLLTQEDAESSVKEIPAQEVEEVSAEADAYLVQESSEVNRLVEAFNESLSLDPGSREVTAGCLVGTSLTEAKEGNEEETSRLSGAQAGGAGEASSSGSLELGPSPVEESRISNQVAVEATSLTASVGDHRQVQGMDGDADQQKSTEGNLGNHPASGTSVVPPPDHLNAERTYVWYACYASNLLMARFMCYIKGGQVEGMGKVCTGSRNQAPPVASRWIMVPYHMFFGHSWTRTWGSGGVAFLDPVSHGGAPTTHVRLYKITLQQLQDLLIQENEEAPNSSLLLLEWDHINALRDMQSASSHATLDIVKDSWYGSIKYLGDEDGLPMLTITCSVEDMQGFRKRQFQVCPPSESYFTVILKGLLEHETLSEEQSKAYIASKSKGFPEDANVDQILKR